MYALRATCYSLWVRACEFSCSIFNNHCWNYQYSTFHQRQICGQERWPRASMLDFLSKFKEGRIGHVGWWAVLTSLAYTIRGYGCNVWLPSASIDDFRRLTTTLHGTSHSFLSTKKLTLNHTLFFSPMHIISYHCKHICNLSWEAIINTPGDIFCTRLSMSCGNGPYTHALIRLSSVVDC